MGKRSSFARIEHDHYVTPVEAVVPLVPHLVGITQFCEPCCGPGRVLVGHLESFGLRCLYAGDVVEGQDALDVERFAAPIISNPPWSRPIMHRLIAHFIRGAPFAWLLIDANWALTKQARPFLKHCSLILPIGRVKWIPGSAHNAKDDAAWFKFEGGHTSGPVLLSYRSEPTTARICAAPSCGRTFSPERSTARFCSDACRQRAHRADLSVTLA